MGNIRFFPGNQGGRGWPLHIPCEKSTFLRPTLYKPLVEETFLQSVLVWLKGTTQLWQRARVKEEQHVSFRSLF